MARLDIGGEGGDNCGCTLLGCGLGWGYDRLNAIMEFSYDDVGIVVYLKKTP